MTERTRLRTQGPVIEDLHWLNGVNQTDGGTVPCLMYEEVETMSDVVTDNYHKRSDAGEIINNPCNYIRNITESSGGGSYRSENPDGSVRQINDGNGSVTAAMASYHGVDIRSLLTMSDEDRDTVKELSFHKAVGKIDSTPYAFLEDALEIRETLRFLRNPFLSLRKLARSFRKDAWGYMKKKRQRTRDKALADTWLEYRFAFSPLIQSSFNAYALLQDKTVTRPLRITARGWDSRRTADNTVVVSNNGKFAWFSRKREVRYEAKSGILHAVSNPLADIQFKAGLRAKDIPEGLWAIMPYSFMVDRVLDISGGIRGIRGLLDPNVMILAGWTTARRTAVTSDQCIGQDHPTIPVDVFGDTIRTQEFEYDRQPRLPEIADVIPTLNVGGLITEASFIADLGALIVKNVRLR